MLLSKRALSLQGRTRNYVQTGEVNIRSYTMQCIEHKQRATRRVFHTRRSLNKLSARSLQEGSELTCFRVYRARSGSLVGQLNEMTAHKRCTGCCQQGVHGPSTPPAQR